MRVAICFYGKVGSREQKDGIGELLPPEIVYKSYVKHILSHQDCDIFIHTWSTEHEEELVSLYKPKAILAEPQKIFKISWRHYLDLILKQGYRNILNIKNCDKFKVEIESIHRAYSRWYSNKKTLTLMEEEQAQLGKNYDCVFVTRLDVAFFTDLIFGEYDLDRFWASNWNDPPRKDNNYTYNFMNHYLGKGFLDFWFFSNSKYMSIFGTLFDSIKDYNYSPHIASYEHVRSFTDQISYTLFRWKDFEMARRYYYQSEV